MKCIQCSGNALFGTELIIIKRLVSQPTTNQPATKERLHQPVRKICNRPTRLFIANLLQNHGFIRQNALSGGRTQRLDWSWSISGARWFTHKKHQLIGRCIQIAVWDATGQENFLRLSIEWAALMLSRSLHLSLNTMVCNTGQWGHENAGRNL